MILGATFPQLTGRTFASGAQMFMAAVGTAGFSAGSRFFLTESKSDGALVMGAAAVLMVVYFLRNLGAFVFESVSVDGDVIRYRSWTGRSTKTFDIRDCNGLAQMPFPGSGNALILQFKKGHLLLWPTLGGRDSERSVGPVDLYRFILNRGYGQAE